MERVQSPSNPSDLPLRQEAAELCQLLGATDHGPIELPAGLLSFLMQAVLTRNLPKWCALKLRSVKLAERPGE